MTKVDKVIAGLQILNKHPNCEIASDHDSIYAGSWDLKLSGEDQRDLIHLGWLFDDQQDSWFIFV